MQTTQTYLDGTWHEGNIAIFGVEEYCSWLGMSVFDGARAFDGLFPDGDKHCQRSIRSAEGLGLTPEHTWEEIHDICIQGINRFEPGSHLYVRIEFWDKTKYTHARSITSQGTGFAVIVEELPLAPKGFTANMSKYQRCASNQAPTFAKASCLYPAGIMAVKQAKADGFDDAVMCDPDSKVAEFTMSNIFLVYRNSIITPKPNGTFLNGITRQTFIKLFESEGYNVEERTVYPAELDHCDEIFSTGNASKVQPCVRYRDRELTTKFADIAWDLYLDYAQQSKI